MNFNRYLTIPLIIIVFLLPSCSEAPMKSKNNDIQLSSKEIDSYLKTVGKKRIFFGHQSVGNNILAGIDNISKDRNHKINIIKSRVLNEQNGNALLHANVGKNTDPLSKINDFKELIENGMGGNVDAAFLKLCYVDFNQNTDLKLTFQKYKKTMQSLKENYLLYYFFRFQYLFF